MNNYKISMFSIVLLSSNMLSSMQQEEHEHISNYIGQHAFTTDFTFQEQIRKNDLFIKQLVENAVGKKKAETFFVNGWGQIIGALIALKEKDSTPDFKQHIAENIAAAVGQAASISNPFLKNVRTASKKILMYPHHEGNRKKLPLYFTFQDLTITEPTDLLNNYVKDAQLEFALYMGKLYLKINPEGEDNIFRKLWKTDFAAQLAIHGYQNVKPNNECPHITLVNSNVIEAIKDSFVQKYGNLDAYQAFFEDFLHEINIQLQQEENPIVFTHLSTTYSEDYSPFEEVIVARLNSIIAQKALLALVAQVKDKLGIEIPVKAQASFHLTIAIKYREPQTLPYQNIEELIYALNAPWLSEFWSKFTM